MTFRFDQTGNRELPQIVGAAHRAAQALVGGHRRRRAASATSRETTLEPPLGSGPYRLKSFDAQRNATYERVPDYWGKDLPVEVGTNNFDQIRYEYFRDSHRAARGA